LNDFTENHKRQNKFIYDTNIHLNAKIQKTMNTEQRIISVIIEKTATGFSAYAKEIDGLATFGNNISEIKANFNEVLKYHVEYLQE